MYGERMIDSHRPSGEGPLSAPKGRRSIAKGASPWDTQGVARHPSSPGGATDGILSPWFLSPLRGSEPVPSSRFPSQGLTPLAIDRRPSGAQMFGLPDRLSQRPRFALGPVEPAVGLGVADDLLGDGVPLQRPLQPVGDVAQVADGRGAVGDLDVAERQLAGLDAVEEVAEDPSLAAGSPPCRRAPCGCGACRATRPRCPCR